VMDTLCLSSEGGQKLPVIVKNGELGKEFK
jgi:hypothetical protein